MCVVALILTVGLDACGRHQQNASAKVGIKHLATHEDAYVGKKILVHACLATGMHGSYIHPCGSCEPQYVVDVYVTEDKYELIVDTFKRLNIFLDSQINADFIGRIAPHKLTGMSGNSRIIPMLELQQIKNPIAYTPRMRSEKQFKSWVAACLSSG